MKRFATPLAVFALGFVACWLVKDSKRSASTGGPTSVRQVEITFSSGNPDRGGFSGTHNAVVTAVGDGEEEYIIATSETDRP